MILPECNVDSFSLWMCTRSIIFGNICCLLLVITLFGLLQILPIFFATRWYIRNVFMLTLTSLQLALLVYECYVQNSAYLLVFVKYCRGLQVALACYYYGRLACELLHTSYIFYRVLLPIVFGTMTLMTSNALMVFSMEKSIDCHHFTWLMMSTAQFMLAVSFAIPAIIVLDELNEASQRERKLQLNTFSSVSTTTEVQQSHAQMWVMMIGNMIATSFQLCMDLYVTYMLGNESSCDSMFFENGQGVLEQSIHLLTSIISFALPNATTIYVFYYLPRFQFQTNLDINMSSDFYEQEHLMNQFSQEGEYQLLLSGEHDEDECI